MKDLTVGVIVFLIRIGVGLLVSTLPSFPMTILAGTCIGFYFLFAILVVDQREKVDVLRSGRYRGLRGAGFFLIIPTMVKAILRERATGDLASLTIEVELAESHRIVSLM